MRDSGSSYLFEVLCSSLRNINEFSLSLSLSRASERWRDREGERNVHRGRFPLVNLDHGCSYLREALCFFLPVSCALKKIRKIERERKMKIDLATLDYDYS